MIFIKQITWSILIHGHCNPNTIISLTMDILIFSNIFWQIISLHSYQWIETLFYNLTNVLLPCFKLQKLINAISCRISSLMWYIRTPSIFTPEISLENITTKYHDLWDNVNLFNICWFLYATKELCSEFYLILIWMKKKMCIVNTCLPSRQRISSRIYCFGSWTVNIFLTV